PAKRAHPGLNMNENSRSPHVVNVDSLQWSEGRRGDRYEWRRIQLGAAAGGEKLGCSLYEIPPGRRAFPYHSHLANVEAIYVLEEQGTLRLGERQSRCVRATTSPSRREKP